MYFYSVVGFVISFLYVCVFFGIVWILFMVMFALQMHFLKRKKHGGYTKKGTLNTRFFRPCAVMRVITNKKPLNV